MKRKRLITFVIGIGFFGLLLFLINWILRYEITHQSLPIKSETGRITITSNGCCLWAENVSVSILDESGNKTILSQTEKVYEDDIFKNKIPDNDLSQFSVLLELSVYYPDERKFSKKVLKYNNIQEFKKNGLLIYIQEADGAYINIISGKNHVSYKLTNSAPYTWDKLEEPHKVYPLD